MNINIFKYIFSFLLIFIPIAFASANIIVEYSSEKPSLEVKSVNKVISTGYTRFDFFVSNPQNLNLASTWELRLWCEKGVIFSTVNSSENICNKNIDISSLLKNDRFSLFYKNPTTLPNSFKLKLKAFDGNGKWIFSDKKTFFWK